MYKQQCIIRLLERGGGFALWSVRFFSQEQNFLVTCTQCEVLSLSAVGVAQCSQIQPYARKWGVSSRVDAPWRCPLGRVDSLLPLALYADSWNGWRRSLVVLFHGADIQYLERKGKT